MVEVDAQGDTFVDFCSHNARQWVFKKNQHKIQAVPDGLKDVNLDTWPTFCSWHVFFMFLLVCVLLFVWFGSSSVDVRLGIFGSSCSAGKTINGKAWK